MINGVLMEIYTPGWVEQWWQNCSGGIEFQIFSIISNIDKVVNRDRSQYTLVFTHVAWIETVDKAVNSDRS